MTDEIQLRDLTEEDLPTLFEQQNDPEANRMAGFPARSKDAFMEHWKIKVFGNETGVKKAIIQNNRVTGYVLCWEQEGKLLIGYWLGRDYWGKGIASEALLKFLTHLKSRPLHAFVAKHNVGSIRVLEKCGFKVTLEVTHQEIISSELLMVLV